MTQKEFNEKLREIFKTLITDNFKQTDISNMTFGIQKQDQFRQFVKNGRDMTLKPIIPMFDGFEFEIHLVPVLKSDIENKEIVNRISNDSFRALQLMLLDSLQRTECKRRTGIEEFIINKINSLKE